MSLQVQVLFDSPRQELASTIDRLLYQCVSVTIVCGFATVEGIRRIERPLIADPTKLRAFAIGAATYGGFEALDRLISRGVAPTSVLVNLGHTRLTTSKAKYPFYRYHPMMHSKVYLFDLPDGECAAIVGSHNVTGFALMGLNGEAAIMIRGPSSDPELQKVRMHVGYCLSESIPYSPTMKAAYSWWTIQSFEGLVQKARSGQPAEFDHTRTIVVLAALAGPHLPGNNDVIYFEVPEELNLRAVGVEVHLYLFDSPPPNPTIALQLSRTCKAKFWCRTLTVGNRQRVTEGRTNWHIPNRTVALLSPAPQPFRPTTVSGMVQVFVEVVGDLRGRFDYEFSTEKAKWKPVLNNARTVEVASQDQALLLSLNVSPPEHLRWNQVVGLEQQEPDQDDAYRAAYQLVVPESGNFILVSTRRRKLTDEESRG